MADESVDRIAEFRDEVDVEAQRFERARERIGPLNVTDTSGAVRVHTDADGLVTQVDVDTRWRDRLQPEGMGAAVQDAYGNAVAERSRAWAGEFTDEAQPEPRPRPAQGIDSSAASQVMTRLEAAGEGADVQVILERMVQLLEDLDQRLDDGLARADRMAVQEYAGQSGPRHVRARVSGGGTLVGLEYDDRWLPQAHPFNIGRETTEAVHDALRALADSQSTDQDPMAELRQLAEDPSALADYLGIIDH